MKFLPVKGMSALAGLLVLAATNSNAGVIALDSALDLQVDAQADELSKTTDLFNVTQSGSIDTLSGAVNATSGDIDVNVSAEASWASAAEGSVTFNDVSWTIGEPGLADTAQGFGWVYEFVSDSDTSITFNYDVVLDPDTTWDFGLGGFWLEATNYIDYEYFYMEVGESGSLSIDVLAHEDFRVRISSNANISSGDSGFNAGMSGTFDWTIGSAAQVPEPSTYALLGMGFLLLMSRRK